ncbi:MAG: hypothetical protein R3F62_25795 [Planctomycetota bacterium]
MKRWGWLALGLTLLGLQSAWRPGIQARQEQAELVLPTTEGASADLSVPVLALGAFRGLVVDYLWLRAETLRREERYLEARQLNRQICRLQPRVWITWNHLAHDLAYNVSREHGTPEARWRWIQAGIRVLRDDGLRFNPTQPQLYLRLASTFEDKIGGYADDFHQAYKRIYALELHRILGDATLAELAAAPAWGEDPGTRDLVAELEGGELAPWELLVDAAALEPEAVRATWGEDLGRALLQARERPAYPAALLAARKHALWQRERLDPARMLEVEARWGRLDWRTCHAASVYWAELGRRVARDQGELWDAVQLERVALMGLRNAMRRGRVVILPNDEVWLRSLPELAPTLDRNYRETIAALEVLQRQLEAKRDGPGGEGALTELERELQGNLGGHLENMRSTHLDQLVESISLLSDFGLDADGERLYEGGRATYPEWNGWREGYRDFVTRIEVMRYADSSQIFESHSSLSQYVEGCWIQAYRAIAFGEDERFEAQRLRAQRAQRRWEAHVARQAAASPREAERLAVPFEAIRLRAAYTAAQSLSPQLRQRLADRAGLAREVLETPPPDVDLPPAKRGAQ